VRWTRGGADFGPGECSKTYVLARQDFGGITDGLRNGPIWDATGDIISCLGLTARNGTRTAAMEEPHQEPPQPQRRRASRSRSGRCRYERQGGTPEVRRVDLIVGQITGPTSKSRMNTKANVRTTTAPYRRSPERPLAPFTVRPMLPGSTRG